MSELLQFHKFEKLVKNRFNLYNSMFLNLPYINEENIGVLIPILYKECENGLESGKHPMEILDVFFNKQNKIKSEKEKIDFMFRVIQYVERQVVLYDSVEDAAFPDIQKSSNDLSLKDFVHLFDNQKSLDTSFDKLSTFSARLVLTAHPTQFYPPAVLDIITKLRSLIIESNINEIDITLQQLGLTSLINSEKPTPLDEAKNIIYFLRNVYYDSIGELYSYIRNQIPHKDFDNTDIVKLGFWPGGDRDGNPFVTFEITKIVVDELRMSLMKCYYKDIKNLEQKLSFKEVDNIVADLKTELYTAMFDSNKIIRFKEIISPLYKVRDFIINKYNSLYLNELDNVIDKVKIFKTHFATLDIRQDHSIHKKIIEELLIKKNIINSSLEELSKEELMMILLHKDLAINPEHFDNEIINDTILTITELKYLQSKNGEEGCNRYIISNSEDVFSVLFVYALIRWCGWKNKNITFDIIPLFETMEGMRNAEEIMSSLFKIPEYSTHIKQRGNKQTVMLGFSDGTKDGGYLKANWFIFKTKEKLSAVCDHYGIRAVFFDGRGGPPARGGGKTHRFYAAQSKEIANHEIQLTIQGQTISSKYGTKEHFKNNCEQLLTAGLFKSFFNKENTITEKSRKTIEKLAQLSFEKYVTLKNHPKFIPYLENRSTLRFYSDANIGSRPAKRGQKKILELKDLRAISYVGSWSQLKQNVPGYFGIGTALKLLENEGKLDDLKQLFSKVPFFKALILNSMMALSKCNFKLTAYMANDKVYKDFWNMLFEEYKLSKQMVLLISGYSKLMEEEPVSKKSIEIREQIVLPLLVIQQYALQKIEQASKFKTTYEKIVKRSLYGNINASRNSA